MSDAGAPIEGRGGPSWMQGGPARLATPSTVTQQPPTHFIGSTTDATPGSSEVLFSARYSRNGTTPIAYMIVAFAAMAAAWWAIDWSAVTAEATEPVRSSEWWTSITSVLLPGEDLRLVSFSQFRMWVAIALLVLAAGSVAVWIGRIGGNVRPSHAPFGVFVPLIALPAWWLLPLTSGATSDPTRSRSDLLLRYLVAFGILFTQFLLLRWPALNRIWRAGHLRYDLASIVLWLPMMIPWMVLFASNAFTYLAIGDDGAIADSAWRPTSAMLDWARNVTRASSIGIVILLVAVSVAQHLGMAKDRRDDDAGRLGPDAVQQPVS